MIINIKRTGGFAGTTVEKVVDTDALNQQEGLDIEAMVRTAIEHPPKAGGGHADGFRYELTVLDGSKKHAIRCAEGPQESTGELLSRLTAVAFS